MLYRKDIEPRCVYCAHGSEVSDTEIACRKKGITPASGSCRAFSYDPLKRVPPKPATLLLRGLKDEDFKLD